MTTGQKIEAQLDELDELREDFIDNLEAKGVTGLIGDEKFDELVPKVLETKGEMYKPNFLTFRQFTGQDLSYETSNVDTSLITNMGNMFQSCSNLTSLDLSNFNTSNVTNMGGMFQSCSSLKTIDLSKCDIKSTGLAYMFQGCNSLEEIKLPKVTISNPSTLYMFQNTTKLSKLNLEDFKITNLVNAAYMFNNCGLEEIDVSNLSFAAESNNYTNMFNNCKNLKRLKYGSNGYIEFPRYSTGFAEQQSYMFAGCTALEEVNVAVQCPAYNRGMNYWFQGCSNLEKVRIFKGNNPYSSSNQPSSTYTFNGCSKLKDVIFYNYAESIASADYMFNGCSSLTELTTSGFRINYGAKYAFAGCSSLRFLDISASSCFSKDASYNTGAFNSVPNNCIILVNSAATRTKIQSSYPNLTNIYTNAEYYGSNITFSSVDDHYEADLSPDSTIIRRKYPSFGKEEEILKLLNVDTGEIEILDLPRPGSQLIVPNGNYKLLYYTEDSTSGKFCYVNYNN